MSHIHHIGGNANAAAEYQEYLARLGGKRPTRTFDSAIDTERDFDRDPGGDAEDKQDRENDAEADKTPLEGADAKPGWHAKA